MQVMQSKQEDEASSQDLGHGLLEFPLLGPNQICSAGENRHLFRVGLDILLGLASLQSKTDLTSLS